MLTTKQEIGESHLIVKPWPRQIYLTNYMPERKQLPVVFILSCQHFLICNINTSFATISILIHYKQERE